jgi:hypothetical protein
MALLASLASQSAITGERSRAQVAAQNRITGQTDQCRKEGATDRNGRVRDAKCGTGDASRQRLRVSRHRRKPFVGSDLCGSVTRVTRVTRNRGPFPGGGGGGEGSPSQVTQLDLALALEPERDHRTDTALARFAPDGAPVGLDDLTAEVEPDARASNAV